MQIKCCITHTLNKESTSFLSFKNLFLLKTYHQLAIWTYLVLSGVLLKTYYHPAYYIYFRAPYCRDHPARARRCWRKRQPARRRFPSSASTGASSTKCSSASVLPGWVWTILDNYNTFTPCKHKNDSRLFLLCIEHLNLIFNQKM